MLSLSSYFNPPVPRPGYLRTLLAITVSCEYKYISLRTQGSTSLLPARIDLLLKSPGSQPRKAISRCLVKLVNVCFITKEECNIEQTSLIFRLFFNLVSYDTAWHSQKEDLSFINKRSQRDSSAPRDDADFLHFLHELNLPTDEIKSKSCP